MLGTLCKNTHWKNTSLKIKVWKLLDTAFGKDMTCRGPHLKTLQGSRKNVSIFNSHIDTNEYPWTFVPLWLGQAREREHTHDVACLIYCVGTQVLTNCIKCICLKLQTVFVQITTCICPKSPLTVWLAWSTVLAFQRRRTHQKTTIHTMYLIHSVIHSAIYLHKHLQHQVHMDKQFVDLPCSPFSIYTYPGCWVDNFNYIFDGVEFVFELHCRYNSSSSFCKRYAGGDALYRSSCIFFEFLYLWTIRDINNISEINKNIF